MKSKTETPEINEKDVTIQRTGKIIILPEGMSYKEAHTWLTRKEEAEEQVIVVNDSLVCYPLDGLVALQRAINKLYGFYTVHGGFFSPGPDMITVKLWGGDTITVPYGTMTIPTWDKGTIDPIVTPEMKLGLQAQVKRKHEDKVKELFTEVKAQLKADSIYRGKAIKVNLGFLSGEEDFHPEDSAPRFLDEVMTTNESDIILNPVTQFEVSNDIYSFIERTDALKKNRVNLKHGVVLASTYGMGKTLLGQIIGGKAVRNNWTFIYLEDINQIASALKFAETYAPAVIFAEDIDQVTSGQRNSRLNQILNTIDGVDTKGKAIVTVLTTNNVDSIEAAFLRAGRVNSLIFIDKPDAETAQRFVRLYAGDTLADDVDLEVVGKELAGMTPAFITEACQKAKRHALYRTSSSDITGKVTTNDLVLAAQSMAKHIRLAEQKTQKTPAEQVVAAARVMGAVQMSNWNWNADNDNGRASNQLANTLALIQNSNGN